MLLAIAYDQHLDARQRPILVGKVPQPRLLRLAVEIIALYGLVAGVDFATAAHASARVITGTAGSLVLAILLIAGLVLRSCASRWTGR